MPELPEVETIVRTLRPSLVARTLRGIAHLRPDIVRCGTPDVPRRLQGRRVKGVNRHGKRICIQLDDQSILMIQLGMSGQLTIDEATAPVRPHTHFIVDIAGKRAGSPHLQLRYRDPRRFGGIRLCTNDDARDRLGPEPLDMRASEFAASLSRTRRAVKTALLDQALIAGIGNIYADEALFETAIHPATPANRLGPYQTTRLARAIKRVLRRAILHRGSTLRDYVDVNGQSGRFQNLHRVYGQAGNPCQRCGNRIERFVMGGRSTHFCPFCQSHKQG